MEREHWSLLSQAVSNVDQGWKHCARDTHPTALIARVYLWAALHDRSVRWACNADNWTAHTRPPSLPDQSCMSRRTRRKDFERFLLQVGHRLNGKPQGTLVKRIDGKPLELANHSGDRDAGWGRGVARLSLGYKLHAVWSENPMPEAFAITSLDVCEKRMAARLFQRIDGCGYLLGDTNYDASYLHDQARLMDHQLLTPRSKPFTGLGHRYQSPQRIRSILMLEPPANVNDFGQRLYQQRAGIERNFACLCSFGGGLQVLPSWIRRIWRVRHWVLAKLLINAARIRQLRKKAVDA